VIEETEAAVITITTVEVATTIVVEDTIVRNLNSTAIQIGNKSNLTKRKIMMTETNNMVGAVEVRKKETTKRMKTQRKIIKMIQQSKKLRLWTLMMRRWLQF